MDQIYNGYGAHGTQEREIIYEYVLAYGHGVIFHKESYCEKWYDDIIWPNDLTRHFRLFMNDKAPESLNNTHSTEIIILITPSS